MTSNLSQTLRLPHNLAVVLIAVACLAGASTFGALPEPTLQKYRTGVEGWPPPEVDEGIDATELGPLPPIPDVDWHTEASEELGRLLFFDPRLSSSEQIACASCHDSLLGWTDGRTVSFGHNRSAGRRNSMTLLNVAFRNELFWDGRAAGLLELIPLPIENPTEMHADPKLVTKRIAKLPEYRQAFNRAFESEDVTVGRIAVAIASFVRTIRSRQSSFDRFVRGETDRLTAKELEGLHLFRTKARCMNCHHGPSFSDGKFHHTGLSYIGRRFEDLGRFHVTGQLADRGKFRTPSLRDLQFTGPWMHNGLFTNFTGILRMYNHGITFNSRSVPKEPRLSPLIRPLGLSTDEIASLEAFLHTLSQRPSIVRPPVLPGGSTFQHNVFNNTRP